MVDWRIFLVLGALAACCIPLLDRFGLRDVLYFPIVLYSIAGACWGIWMRHRPEPRAPWILFVAALVSQLCGALVQANTDAGGDFGAGVSVADLLYLAGHLCMASALWQLASHQHREFPRHGFFQGAILATSLMMIGWQFLFLPTIADHGFSIGRPQVFRMIYPTLAFAEIGLVLWLWTSSEGRRSGAFRLLAAATVLFAAGESFFHGTSSSLGVPGNFNLILWLLGYVGYGTVALHPGVRELATPRLSEEGRHAKNVLALLLPLVLFLPIGLLVVHYRDLHPATVGILIGFFMVILLGWYQLRQSIKSIVRVNRLLEQQSRTDHLTGIPNRNHMEHVIATTTFDPDKRNGLLLIDIDGFKSINNMLGFHMGDAIIKAVAGRFHAESLKKGHPFARVDGDEFALLMLNVESRQAVQAQAWRIHRLLDSPVAINGVAIKVTCSIGVSISHAFQELDFASMLKESERALGWARERQSQVEIYHKSKDLAEDKSWVLADFRDAIAAHEFVVHYQPKVRTSSKKVIGVEALVRWQHPQRGLVMPQVFMQSIEATDLVHQLFVLVLTDATRQWQAWSDQGMKISIALNVVARDLMHFDLAQEIGQALARHRMPAQYLEIEITESSALSDPSHVKQVLQGLMALGVKLSIDDYGTGYSSLLYLQQLPLHFLKIDQQFIREMRSQQSSATIVRSTMELARSLKLKVIAEGVEDDGVYQELKLLGCYGVQGFLFSKAVAADRVLEVVRQIEAEGMLQPSS